MRTRNALVTIMPAVLAVVCMQSSNTEAQDTRLSAAVNAAAPLTFNLIKETTEAQAAETLAYWTAERLANAQPMLPKVSEKASAAPEAAAQEGGTSVSLPAKRPTVPVGAESAVRLYDPAQVRIQAEAGGVESQAVGTGGVPYTSARVNQPGLETIFPNRTVGKLFFRIGSSNFVCSASVLRQRIVLTAGHCVHRGSGGTAGFYSNFVFIPALRDGVGPLGTFTPRIVGTTSQWATGGGVVSNVADFGMLEMNDRGTTRIGSITGFLGFRTISLSRNHTTKLGYPCNIDLCQKMQQVTSQARSTTLTSAPNNVEYGSNAGGGSSGGPWVQNYGIQGTGGVPSSLGLNQVVGVTSYGYVSTAIQLQGSSIPDSRAGGFIPLLNTMCAARVGNC